MCTVTPRYRNLAPLAVLLFASCSWLDATPTNPHIRPAASAAKAAPPPPDSVLLGMTLNDSAVFQIGSDGLGEYVDGASGMMVQIDVWGNLQISPNNANSSSPPARRLDVRYPGGLVHTYPAQWNFKFKSNRTNNTNPRIQDMTVGAALCYNVTLAHQNQQVAYENDFNGLPGSTYALITRTSATTWSAISKGVASTGLNCGVDDTTVVKSTNLTVKNSKAVTVGPVSLPFSLTLRVLP